MDEQHFKPVLAFACKPECPRSQNFSNSRGRPSVLKTPFQVDLGIKTDDMDRFRPAPRFPVFSSGITLGG